MMDALIAPVDVEIPVNVQEGDAKPLNQESFYLVGAGFAARAVFGDTQGVELGAGGCLKDNPAHAVPVHGGEGIGELLFIQRQEFPDFNWRGPVVQSND